MSNQEDLESVIESQGDAATSALGAVPGSPCWERGYNFDTGVKCECGGSLHVGDNADGMIYDGDEYECENCEKHGSFVSFEDGSIYAVECLEENTK